MRRPCADILVEEMHMPETSCDALLKETAEALNEDVVALMLLALERKNLELSVHFAVKWWVFHVEQWRLV